MSEPNNTDDLTMSNPTEASDHSDVDSDVINDWALVSSNGELQDSGDESSSLSGSSIEVMSLEDDLDIEESSNITPMAAEARTPVFILRVPSTEAALRALTTESDESDESEHTEDSCPVSDQQHQTSSVNIENKALDNTHLVDKGNKTAICDNLIERETTPSSDIDDTGNDQHAVADTGELQEAHEETLQMHQASVVETQPSCSQENSSLDVPLVPSEDINALSGQSQSGDLNVNPGLQDEGDPMAELDNDNVINEILEEDALEFMEVVLPSKEDKDVEPEQGDVAGIPDNEEMANVEENDFDVIFVNREGLHQYDQRYDDDIQQDDPETESSTEMDAYDDRIESDQSDLHTTDNSNLSNVDISDMMENIHVNRQYLHHPKPWIDVFLNIAVVLVVSVAIGMGIGHNLGSAPSWKISQQKTVCHHRNVDDFIHHTILDQKLDRCERKLITREETLAKRHQKLFQENQKLKDEANVLKNEVYDLRSEVIRLKYKRSQEVALRDASQQFRFSNRESITAALVKANQLEQENSDLRLEIGRLKYGYHSNQKTPALTDAQEAKNDKKEKVKDESDTKNFSSEINSLKNELDMERERSEMWKKLYQVKVEEIKTNKQRADNSTKDVFGCVKLMLRNLSLPVNISEKIEEQWKSLQNVSLTGFVEILKSYVHSEKHDNESKWSSGSKKGQTRWSDTVSDVLNKTKASVNEVTQQIQDTWKQVKNLSHDLWKKHEPTISSHLKKVQESMHQATQQIKDTVHNSKWFNRKGKKKNRHRNQFDKRNYQSKKTTSSKTKRRGSGEKHPNKRNQDQYEHKNNKINRKMNKQMKKLHNKIQQLNAEKFEKINCRKQRKTLNRFENIEKRFDTSRLNEGKRFWFECQKSWWFGIVEDRPLVNPGCTQQLFRWQVYISDNCFNCHKRCHDNYWRKKKHNGGQRFTRNQRHYKKHHQHKKSSNFHERPENYHYDQDIGRETAGNHKHFYTQSSNQNNPNEFANDLPGLVFPKEEEPEDEMKKPNLTDIDEYEECDPDLEVCHKSEKNWYLSHMDHRKYERHHHGDEGQDDKSDWLFKRAKERDFERNHHGDDRDGKADWIFKRGKERDEVRNHHRDNNGKPDWMFERAEERDFERNQPDDWYFRRSNEWYKVHPQPEADFSNFNDNVNEEYDMDYGKEEVDYVDF